MMEALFLLATLGPASCLLGITVGVNLRRPQARYAVRRASIWLLICVAVWFAWPSYNERLSLWKHMLVYSSVFVAGVLGGITYAKAIRRQAP